MNPLPITHSATSHPCRRRQGLLDITWRSLHHHHHRHHPPSPSLSATPPSSPSWGWLLLGAACRHCHPHPCRLPPPQPYQRRNQSRLAPVLLPPHRRHGLSALLIAHGAILDLHGVSTPSGTTWRVPLPPAPPLSKEGTIAPAPPSQPPRCLGLLSSGRCWTLLRFSCRRRRSGDGNGSTLTLTLVPGASGAATTTPDLPGNLRRPWDCWRGVWILFLGCFHGLCCGCHFCWCVLDFLCVVVCAGSHELHMSPVPNACKFH